MSNETYRAAQGLSKSDLFKMSKSPKHFRYALEHKSPPTAAMLFGTAFHAYVLEPERFAEEFVCSDISLRTKQGKELMQRLEADGKTLISESDLAKIQAMSDSIFENKYAAALLNGEKEMSYFSTERTTGIAIKCRPDCRTVLGKEAVIVDLKTCTSAQEDDFYRDCMRYGYDLQAAMYTHIVDEIEGVPHRFIFIACEKEPPYDINILEADDYIIKKGRTDMNIYLDMVKHCIQTGDWYGCCGADSRPGVLEMPAWQARKYDFDI